MIYIRRISIIVAIVTLSALSVSAEMPEVLKGSWILNAQATEKYMKTSPKWKAEDEKYLPTVLKRMSQMQYEFTDEAIVVSMRGKKQSLPVVLKSGEPRKYVFDGKMGDKAITMTVLFVDDLTINVRSSATDDMAYYLWKRGAPGDKDGPSDKSLAVELMKKSIEKKPVKKQSAK